MAKALAYIRKDVEVKNNENGVDNWYTEEIDITTPQDIRDYFGIYDVSQILIDRWQKMMFYCMDNLGTLGVTGKIEDTEGNLEMFCSPFILAEGSPNERLVDITQETIDYFNEHAQLL